MKILVVDETGPNGTSFWSMNLDEIEPLLIVAGRPDLVDLLRAPLRGGCDRLLIADAEGFRIQDVLDPKKAN